MKNHLPRIPTVYVPTPAVYAEALARKAAAKVLTRDSLTYYADRDAYDQAMKEFAYAVNHGEDLTSIFKNLTSDVATALTNHLIELGWTVTSGKSENDSEENMGHIYYLHVES